MSDSEKLIIDGNAFYELDMDCVNRKRKRNNTSDRDKKKNGNVSPGRSIQHGRLDK